MDFFEKIKDGPIVLDNIMPSKLSTSFKHNLFEFEDFRIGDSFRGTSGFSNDYFIKNKVNNIFEQGQLTSQPIKNLEPRKIIDLHRSHIQMLPLTLAGLHLGFSFDVEDILRCKINFQYRAPKSSIGKYNFPHVDLVTESEEVITALYYVNDCDGDTYFFDKQGAANIDDLNSLVIKKQISPKQGRLVLFNSQELHAGSNPIEADFRVVINYNLFINPYKRVFEAIENGEFDMVSYK